MNATTDTLIECLSRALKREFGHYKSPDKYIARCIDASQRAVRNWLDGTCSPRSEDLIKLMAISDYVAQEVHRLVENERVYQHKLATDVQRIEIARTRELIEKGKDEKAADHSSLSINRPKQAV